MHAGSFCSGHPYSLCSLPYPRSKVGKLLVEQADSIDNSAKGNELTLKEIHGEVRGLIEQRAHPLLIVMDDIDRLSSEQMKALFQLVKARMGFTNVVFLLLL